MKIFVTPCMYSRGYKCSCNVTKIFRINQFFFLNFFFSWWSYDLYLSASLPIQKQACYKFIDVYLYF